MVTAQISDIYKKERLNLQTNYQGSTSLGTIILFFERITLFPYKSAFFINFCARLSLFMSHHNDILEQKCGTKSHCILEQIPQFYFQKETEGIIINNNT